MPSSSDIYENIEEDFLDDNPCYIWNSSSILLLLMYTVCPSCKFAQLDINYSSIGISTHAELRCKKNCGFKKDLNLDFKSKKGENNELNVKAVVGSLNAGASYISLKKILSQLHLKSIASCTFTTIAKKVTAKSLQVSFL